MTGWMGTSVTCRAYYVNTAQGRPVHQLRLPFHSAVVSAPLPPEVNQIDHTWGVQGGMRGIPLLSANILTRLMYECCRQHFQTRGEICAETSAWL